MDGEGRQAQALFIQAKKNAVILELKEPKKIPPVPCRITLGAALVQGRRFDQIVDQATQLGVSEIIPLLTQRTLVKLNHAREEAKLSRLRTIAQEACRQSGVGYLPKIHPATRLTDLIGSMGSFDLALIASLQGGQRPLGQLLSRAPLASLLLLIGPEGDFTEEEYTRARAAGAHPISLGPSVLRCETAAVVALGIVGLLLRDL